MECSEPGAIRDEELIAYLVGDRVRPVVEHHLARCQACSTVLHTYQRIEKNLTNKLYRWDCPSNHLLGEYQLGILSTQEAGQIGQHLSICVLCAAEVATLTEFLSNDPMLVERRAPQKSQTLAAFALKQRQATQEALGQLRDQALAGARRIVATLVPPQPRLAYQRDSASAVASWPRSYTAEDINITLQVERTPGRRGMLQLIGFVTRNDATLEALHGVPVQLLSSTDVIEQQQIDDLGNFVFSAVAPATYVLEVKFPDSVVAIEQIQVDAEAGL